MRHSPKILKPQTPQISGNMSSLSFSAISRTCFGASVICHSTPESLYSGYRFHARTTAGSIVNSAAHAATPLPWTPAAGRVRPLWVTHVPQIFLWVIFCVLRHTNTSWNRICAYPGIRNVRCVYWIGVLIYAKPFADIRIFTTDPPQ